MNNTALKATVKGCKEINLSGALNEVYKDRNMAAEPPNFIGRILLRLYNMLVSRAPLCYLVNSTQIG